MAREIWANNASTTLNGDITDSATSIVVTDGSVFPSPGTDEYFFVTIDDGTDIEIVKCTARSTNTLTVVRGQQGTSGTAFTSGDTIEMRPTQGTMEYLRGLVIAPRLTSGQYYRAPGFTASKSVNVDISIAHAMAIGNRVTADRIGCYVVTGASSTTVRLGIYADNGSGYPGALVLDAGTVDASTSGAKEITISQVLDPGLYWLAAKIEGSPLTMRAFNDSGNAFTPYMPTLADMTVKLGWTAASQPAGALANPYPAGAGSGSGNVSMIVLRIA